MIASLVALKQKSGEWALKMALYFPANRNNIGQPLETTCGTSV
jgi:hypothetical protein